MLRSNGKYMLEYSARDSEGMNSAILTSEDTRAISSLLPRFDGQNAGFPPKSGHRRRSVGDFLARVDLTQ